MLTLHTLIPQNINESLINIALFTQWTLFLSTKKYHNDRLNRDFQH